ncbi:hypothetical protein ILYODFUR_019119 [Ilyodon furcidens]|uniref:Uncharacterized protein n=1 Tax=Ilyodon furcidens TaxID=33524 RepID=A0ABV0UAH7_9TELE
MLWVRDSSVWSRNSLSLARLLVCRLSAYTGCTLREQMYQVAIRVYVSLTLAYSRSNILLFFLAHHIIGKSMEKLIEQGIIKVHTNQQEVMQIQNLHVSLCIVELLTQICCIS